MKSKHFYNLVLDSCPHMSDTAIRIMNYMLYVKNKKQLKWSDYIPLSWEHLKNFSNNYGQYIIELVQNAIIVVNNDYEPGSHCKSYKFTYPAQLQIINKQYTKTIVTSQENIRMKMTNSDEMNIEIADALISRMTFFYKNIKIDKTWQTRWESPETCGDYGEYVDELMTVKQINAHKGFFLNYGASNGRLYHPIICGTRRLRKYARYNKQELVDIDVTAAHPMLLGKFCKDEQEKQNWLQFVSNNFYENFVDDENDRDQVKIQFQRAISNVKAADNACVQNIRSKIKQVAPGMHQYFEQTWAAGLHMQLMLQQLEAEIFIALAIEIMHKMFILPMHDGFLCLPVDAAFIKQKLDEKCLQVLGYNLNTHIVEL